MFGRRKSACFAFTAIRAFARQAALQDACGRVVVTPGLDKTSGAGYYFQVSPKEVVIAAGAYMPEKEQLAAIRHWLLDNHVEFRKLLKRPAVRKTFDEFEGEALTRPPKGFPPRSSRDGSDPLQAVGAERDAACRIGARKDFAATMIQHFKLLAPWWTR